MTEKHQIPMQTRAASVAPSTIDAEKRTVELVWSTGAAVKRMSWSGDVFIEELAMDKANVRMGRLNGGAPLLNTHNSYDLRDVIGVVESATVDGKEGRATVRFSSRAEVDPFWKDVQDGIIRNVSVGYVVHKFEDVTQRGGTKTLRAMDWEPMEISLVPIGADAKAGVRSEVNLAECEIVTPDEVRAGEIDSAVAECEIEFMNDMIDHHSEALDICDECMKECAQMAHPELQALCDQVMATCTQQIADMQGWLKDWYGLIHESERSSTQVSERSENHEAEAQTGQAAPPADADGADQLDFLRLQLDLAEREI